jgi:pyrroline-5-carboxylate reductase
LRSGTLGTAILNGIFASLRESSTTPKSETTPSDGSSAPVPSKFIACVRGAASAKRIGGVLGEFGQDLQVLQNENIKGVKAADVVILGCKPYMIKDILAGDDMRDALKGKLLISICAGVTTSQIEEVIYGSEKASPDQCRVVRAIPNTAAVVRQSMTVVATSEPPLSPELGELVTWIFSRVGRVSYIPATSMDAGCALGGSGPAFIALMLQSLADGGVAMGLPRAEAQTIAAQAMRGTADMVLRGEHPAIVIDKISTPGGCTVGGLSVLEDGCVRGTIARSVKEATIVAAELGTGVKLVNGPRSVRSG